MTQESDRRAQSEDKAREEHPVGEWPALPYQPKVRESDDNLTYPTLDEVPFKKQNEK